MTLPDITLITSKPVTVENVELNTVIVIDDKPEQLAVAEKAVKEAGYNVRSILIEQSKKSELWMTINLPGVVGVITDLMFPLSEGSGTQPNGLLVAIHSISLGIPVVICTDGEEQGDHHSGGCGAVRDGYYNHNKKTAFGFEETKSWEAAMLELISRMNS